MKRYLLVLFLVMTFLFTSNWLSSVEAKPFKGGKSSPKKFKAPKPGLPAVKPKPAIPSPFPKPIPKPFPKPFPKPLPLLVPTPFPTPVPTPTPLPSVVVVPPRVIVSIGVVRPIRRIYARSRLVTPIVRSPAPLRIVKILDTTHVVVSQLGRTHKVRLLGLDAATSEEVYPEVHEAALAYMKRAFVGQVVYLDFDSGVGSEDQQGTQIAYVYRSGDRQLVNEAVIEHGFALAAMTYDYEQKTGFRRDQARAEKLNSGVWSESPGLDD